MPVSLSGLIHPPRRPIPVLWCAVMPGTGSLARDVSSLVTGSNAMLRGKTAAGRRLYSHKSGPQPLYSYSVACASRGD